MAMALLFYRENLEWAMALLFYRQLEGGMLRQEPPTLQ